MLKESKQFRAAGQSAFIMKSKKRMFPLADGNKVVCLKKNNYQSSCSNIKLDYNVGHVAREGEHLDVISVWLFFVFKKILLISTMDET